MDPRKENLQASILDRLIDLEPGLSHEPVQSRYFSPRQARLSVIRDIESLLNTKRSLLLPAPESRELHKSVLVYGLQDFTSQNPRNRVVRQQLRQQIEKAISQFEPRLKQVKVIIEDSSPNERNLKFRITGVLTIQPVREPVMFDTYFDLNRGEYVISR